MTNYGDNYISSQLIRELQRYKFFFQHARDIIHFLDKDGRILDVNDAAVEAYQYTKDQLLSMTIFDLRAPESDPVTMERVLQSGENGMLFESIHRRKDGTTFPAEISARGMIIDGEPLIMDIVRDIKRRKDSEEALMEAESKYRSLVEESLVGVYIIQDGRFRYVNPRMAEIYGYTPDEMAQIPVLESVAPEDRQRIAENLRKRIEGSEKSIHYSFKSIRKDARIIDIDVYGTRTIYHGKPAVIGSLLDITERRMAEQNERMLEEQKRQFYQQTILTATLGKLLITDSDEIKRISGPPVAAWDITAAECLWKIRKGVEQIARDAGMDGPRVFDFILCVGEASTNAIKHAQGGIATLHQVQDGLIFIVLDQGQGIDAIALPEVALKRGYSTAVSLGMGYKEMISLADKVYLSTGPEGTTVAIRMGLHSEEQPVSGGMLPDTW